MNGQPLKTDLERILGRKMEMQNDANCFAMAEALFGAGKGRKLVFGIIRARGAAEELFTKARSSPVRKALPVNGATCPSPRTAHCATAASAVAWRRTSAAADWRRVTPNSSEQKPFKEIAKDYYAGEPKAVEFMKIFFRHFGRSLANLIDVLDPDVVVLGGGVSNFDALYTEGVAEVARYVFSDRLETPIVKHQLGDSAGVIGAALIGVEKEERLSELAANCSVNSGKSESKTACFFNVHQSFSIRRADVVCYYYLA